MATTTDIAARQLSFDELLSDLPKDFGRDLFHCHLGACLSALFPGGEDYFVRSVRSFRDAVTDPQLKKQVNGFIGQEAVHSREHIALNERLAELGYKVRWVDKDSRRILALRERAYSPIKNLAATAALEHFTAIFAEVYMGEEDSDDSVLGHPGAHDIFLWHALEECEHKAVAFDVFRVAGGTERTRKRVMNATAAMFLTGLVVYTSVSLLTDPDFYKPRNFVGALRGLRTSPLVSRTVWRKVRAYNRTGFHPDDFDTRHLVDRFQVELFGKQGRLTPHLRGAAA